MYKLCVHSYMYICVSYSISQNKCKRQGINIYKDKSISIMKQCQKELIVFYMAYTLLFICHLKISCIYEMYVDHSNHSIPSSISPELQTSHHISLPTSCPPFMIFIYLPIYLSIYLWIPIIYLYLFQLSKSI